MNSEQEGRAGLLMSSSSSLNANYKANTHSEDVLVFAGGETGDGVDSEHVVFLQLGLHVASCLT